MISDTELFELLPSRRAEVLAAAIGRQLMEVERLFLVDLRTFLQNARFAATKFFTHNSGPVQLHFDGGLIHVLEVWPSQLSIVNLPNVLSPSQDEKFYRLSEDSAAPPELRSCLGRVCKDVRIWTLQEMFESEEAKEVAVSYVFANHIELFYCIYLHDDLDSDYLLLGADVPRQRVKSYTFLGQRQTDELK